MTNNASEALAALCDQFQDKLPDRVTAIRSVFGLHDRKAWLPDEAETMHRLVHSLIGSAGTFGMPAVSKSARNLENALSAVPASDQPPDDGRWRAVARALDDLERVVSIRLTRNAPSIAAQPSPLLKPKASSKSFGT